MGVVGAGSLSENHLGAYKQNPNIDLIAICDLIEEHAKAKAETYNIEHVYTDYHEVLQNPELDTISIVTWNNTHKEISIAALDAGKHVLCEKPQCMNQEGALEIKAATRRSDKKFMIGYVRRHASNAVVLKDFINKGTLGEIYYAKASILRRLGNQGGWFSDKSRSGGGAATDHIVHIMYVIRWIFKDEVKSVYAELDTRFKRLRNMTDWQIGHDYCLSDTSTTKNCKVCADSKLI